MPLYEYQCESCAHRFERIQKYSDPPADTCPSCGSGPVRKLLSSPAIQFKGSGFYITDYARKGGDSSGAKSDGAKSDGAKSDGAKPDGAKEAKSDAKSDSAGTASTPDTKPAAKAE